MRPEKATSPTSKRSPGIGNQFRKGGRAEMAPTTVEDEMAIVRELSGRLTNWDRWGPDDQLGTLNFIDAEVVRKATASVRSGRVISLALPLDETGPQEGRLRNNPIHLMTKTGVLLPSSSIGGGAGYTDDLVIMYLQCGTQWDALAHNHWDGLIYGNRAASTVNSEGASHGGIGATAASFVSRGVLLDIARLEGVATLPERFNITVDHLEAAAANQGVAIQSGDILLIRTGLMSQRDLTGNWRYFRKPQPGVHYSTLPWLHEHCVAAIAADNTMVEVFDSMEHIAAPFHMVALRDMGLHIGEYWYLEELAAACAEQQRWTFMLAAQPLPFTRAVGSPVNPLAIL
jgi:kynurenine formamidase